MNNSFKVSSKPPESLKTCNFVHPQEHKGLDSYLGYVLPGIIDVHFHGAFGWDFAFGNEEKINQMLDMVLTTGVTGVVATIMTCPEQHLQNILPTLARIIRERKALPLIHGIHLEGPFLSHNSCGSHEESDLLEPSISKLRYWQELAQGNIKVITIAPELPNAVDFIKEATGMGIKISLGHSQANWQATDLAVKAGATCFTHIFNAMPQIHHRYPNILSYALAHNNLYYELIGDCEHVSPEIVKMLLHSKEISHLLVVSDSVALTGLPDGWHKYYDKTLVKTKHKCKISEGGFFGGALMLPACLHRLATEAQINWSTLGQSVWRNACEFLDITPPNIEIYFDKGMNWKATKYNEEWYTAQNEAR